MTFSADDTHENNENIEEDVKPNVEGDDGLDVMGDFAVDDFDTEDMEALDAVEEKALKTEKVSSKRSGQFPYYPKFKVDIL
jgi:hypothetical protein